MLVLLDSPRPEDLRAWIAPRQNARRGSKAALFVTDFRSNGLKW